MSAIERIEEAHGLWELAVCRLAAFVEAHARQELVDQASTDERVAFIVWRKVSAECLRELAEVKR